jgi:hypothetical protein
MRNNDNICIMAIISFLIPTLVFISSLWLGLFPDITKSTIETIISVYFVSVFFVAQMCVWIVLVEEKDN